MGDKKLIDIMSEHDEYMQRQKKMLKEREKRIQEEYPDFLD